MHPDSNKLKCIATRQSNHEMYCSLTVTPSVELMEAMTCGKMVSTYGAMSAFITVDSAANRP